MRLFVKGIEINASIPVKRRKRRSRRMTHDEAGRLSEKLQSILDEHNSKLTAEQK